jgi:hypothetical protein
MMQPVFISVGWTSFLLSALVGAPVVLLLCGLAWPAQKALSACITDSHPCFAVMLVGLVYGAIWASSSVMIDSSESLIAQARAAFAVLLLLLLSTFVLLEFGYLWLDIDPAVIHRLEPGVVVVLPLLLLLVIRMIRVAAVTRAASVRHD